MKLLLKRVVVGAALMLSAGIAIAGGMVQIIEHDQWGNVIKITECHYDDDNNFMGCTVVYERVVSEDPIEP